MTNSLTTGSIPARMFEDAILKTSREAFEAFKMRKLQYAFEKKSSRQCIEESK